MELHLPVKSPFSLHHTINSHGWIRLAPFVADESEPGFRYLLRLDRGHVIELHITEARGGVNIQIDDDLNKADQEQIKSCVSWILNLELDLSDFYQLVEDEPKLAHVVDGAKGRILRSATLFEDTIKTILTTNTSWAGTIRMVDAIVSQFGSSLSNDADRHAFPTPDQLAVTDVDTLRSQTRLGYRAPYVLELANVVSSGEFDLEALKTSDLPTDKLQRDLLSIKGVGNYAAANLLMILGRYDFIPIDSWATKVVSIEWYDGEPIGPDEVERVFEQWGRWKGLVYWFWDWAYYHTEDVTNS
jgi:3-methyladenine DNA glycosylase/8-oxoguanine DNA glycosylase